MMSPVFLSSLALAAAICLLLRPVAVAVGLVARPGEHRRHDANVPLTGGMAMYLAISLTLLVFVSPVSSALMAAMTLVMGFGLVDDRRPLPYWLRFLVQIAAAFLMIELGGVWLTDLGALVSPEAFTLGKWSSALTVFATVGVINAVNMVDGMDGLAGSLVLVCLLTVLFFAPGEAPSSMLVALTTAGAVSGFLLFNGRFFGRRRALVFMGDAGSTLLGLLVAWLLIEHSQGPQRLFPPVLALWALALPLFDSVGVLLRRLVRRSSPFEADWLHTHHLLLNRGMGVNQALLLMTGVALLLAAAGCFAVRAGIAEHHLFFGFLGLFAVYLVLMETGQRHVT